MKTILSLLLVLSLAVNVGFLSGCAEFHDPVYGNPCRRSVREPSPAPVGDDAKARLEEIADLLGIPTGGKSAADLASDIRYALDRETFVPAGLTGSELARAKNQLSSEQARKIEEIQKFVDSLQGKRIVVVGAGD